MDTKTTDVIVWALRVRDRSTKMTSPGVGGRGSKNGHFAMTNKPFVREGRGSKKYIFFAVTSF